MVRDFHLFTPQIKEDLNQSGHSCFSLWIWPSSETGSTLSHPLHRVGCSENTKQQPVEAGAIFHTALHCQLSLSWVQQCVCARSGSWRQTRLLFTPQLYAEERLWPWHTQFQQDREGLGSSLRTAKDNCYRGTACDKATRFWWGKVNGGKGDTGKLPKEKHCGVPLKIQGMSIPFSSNLTLWNAHSIHIFPINYPSLLCQLPFCFSSDYQGLLWELLFHFSTTDYQSQTKQTKFLPCSKSTRAFYQRKM